MLHHVTDVMEVFEDFIGMSQVPGIENTVLTKVAKDVVCRYNLSLGKLRGHCYDVTSAMKVSTL